MSESKNNRHILLPGCIVLALSNGQVHALARIVTQYGPLISGLSKIQQGAHDKACQTVIEASAELREEG